MRGQVSGDGREALLPVAVSAPTSADDAVEAIAVVDTGFTGELALSADVVVSLGLPEVAVVDVELADGRSAWLGLHAAAVWWDGRLHRTAVLAIDGSSLVGMMLLRDCVLRVNVVPYGEVAVHSRSTLL